MFTAAELIEALRRRTLRSLRPERPAGEFPPGWRAWFAALREQAGLIRGATADAIIAIFLAREPRPAPRAVAALSDWQAFTTLWRQEWEPGGAESRAQRIAALAITLVVELFLAIFLIWLAYARWGGAPPSPGEEVIQVEFIGEGTPRELGGGAPSGPAPEPAAAAPAAAPRTAQVPAQRAPAPAPARATESAPVPPAVAVEAPEPVTEPVPIPPPVEAQPAPEEAAPALQPLQVTEVAVPDTAFTVQVPELATEVESIQRVERPTTTLRAVEAPVASVHVPELEAAPQALPTPAPPLPGASMRSVQARPAQVRVPGLEAEVESLPGAVAPIAGTAPASIATPSATVAVPGLATEVATLPMPGGAPAGSGRSSDAGALPQAEGGGQTVGAPTGEAGGRSAQAGGVQGALAGEGAGPKPGEAAGAWTSPQPGTDWGIADSNRPGGQPGGGGSGLFDESGRVKLPPGTVGDGELGPDGVLETEIADLDRAGTWLKRPPIDYTPTRFDEYWLPGGTLLEEWVRRGIREVAIRIPGTSKRIHCVVSLLQLGGGCGIDDPNMQDQEATARPAPEIPWKPELQENQGALDQPAG